MVVDFGSTAKENLAVPLWVICYVGMKLGRVDVISCFLDIYVVGLCRSGDRYKQVIVLHLCLLMESSSSCCAAQQFPSIDVT